MPVEIFGYGRPPAVHSLCPVALPPPSVAAMHPTDELRVSTRALREAARAMGAGVPGWSAAALADELVAALASLSRDASAGWGAVRATAAAGEAAAASGSRLADSVEDVAAGLRAVADAYDAVDERAAGHQPGPRWAGPQQW